MLILLYTLFLPRMYFFFVKDWKKFFFFFFLASHTNFFGSSSSLKQECNSLFIIKFHIIYFADIHTLSYLIFYLYPVFWKYELFALKRRKKRENLPFRPILSIILGRRDFIHILNIGEPSKVILPLDLLFWYINFINFLVAEVD